MRKRTKPGRGRARSARSRALRAFETLEDRRVLASFYVSATEGSNLQIVGSFEQPFQTIGRAAQFAQAGDTIFIREGVYREQVNLVRSGSEGSPITFKPYNNEEVVVSAGDLITQWNQFNGDIWVGRANFDAGGDSDNNTLFVNGELKHEARQFAENDLLDIDDWGLLEGGGVQSFGNTLQADDLIGFPDDYWNGAKVKFHSLDYAFNVRTIVDYDGSAGRITFDSPVNIITQKQDNGFYIYDTLQALDKPGEWYKEEGNRDLYYHAEPGQDPSTLEIEFKRRAFGFNLSGQDHIHIEGIDFRGASIQTNSGSSHNLLKGNRFYAYDKGNFGRFFLEGENNVFRDNEVSHVWGSVASIDGRGHEIVNNYLHNIGFNGTSRVFTASSAEELLVSHNTVQKFARSFMDGYPSRSEIAYNVFEDGGRITWDTGVFDADGGNGDSSFSIFHHNVFRDTSARGIFEAFYGRNNNAIIHHNVFYDFSSVFDRPALRTGGTDFRQAYHNTIISVGGQVPSGNLEAREAVQTRYNNNIQISLEEMEALGVDVRGNHNYSTNDFASFSGRDFSLAPGSGAIDSGIVIPGINDDFIGAAPDAGAYEFGRTPWVAGHNFTAPPTPEYAWTALPGTNLYENGQFLQGIDDWAIVSGTPNSRDRNSWNLAASNASLTGTFRTGSVEFTPGDAISRTFDGLTPDTTYTLAAYARLANRIGDADTFAESFGTVTTGEHRDEKYVTGLSAGEWVRYANVDFGDPGQYNQLDLLHIRDPSNLTSLIDGVSVQVRLDSPTGTLLAEFDELLNGNALDRWRANREDFSGFDGVHDLYVSVSGTNSENLALGSFRLLNDRPSADDQLTARISSTGARTVVNQFGREDWERGYEEFSFTTGPAATEAFVEFTNSGRLNAYLDRLYLIEGNSTRGGTPASVSSGSTGERLLGPDTSAAAPNLNDDDPATETVTGDTPGAWAQVDLGRTESIYSIELTPAASQPDRLSNFRLSVWNADPQNGGTELWSQDYLTTGGSLSASELLQIQSDSRGIDGETTLGSARGRFVRVELLGTNNAGDNRLAIGELRVNGFDVENLAVTDGVATQSSTAGGLVAGAAIDADLATRSETEPTDTNSWWQVRFPQPFGIGDIELTNRDDAAFGELSNFTVSVWDEDPASGGTKLWEKAYFTSGSVGRGQTFTIDGSEISDTSTRRLASVHTGRVVRVQLNGTNNAGNGRLSLAEVQVSATDTSPPLRNLAQRGVAEQLRDFYGDGGASDARLAVDGRIFPESNFTSSLPEVGTWWQVDLQEQAEIDQIVMFNRTDAASRLNNFRVAVWDGDPQSGGAELWGRNYNYSSGSSAYSTGSTIGAGGALIIDGTDTAGGLRLDQVSGGQYVRVQLQDSNILSLAEVQVWGPDTSLRVASTSTTFDYDLGTTESPVASGSTRISPATFGDVWWIGDVSATYRGGSGVDRDFVTGQQPATLNHKIPNGFWRVTLQMGDPLLALQGMRVSAEDDVVSTAIDTTAGQFAQVEFDIAVTDGELNLSFDGGGPNGWAVNSLAITNAVPPVTLPGDYNTDGFVDAADYTVWRDAEGTGGILPNDTTPGVVDSSDLQVWRGNYGAILSQPVTTVLIGATLGNGEFAVDDASQVFATGGGSGGVTIDLNRDRALRSLGTAGLGLGVPGWTSSRVSYVGGNAAFGFDGNYGFATDAGTGSGQTGQAFVNSGSVDVVSVPVSHAFSAGDEINLSYLLGSDNGAAPDVDADVRLVFDVGLPTEFVHSFATRTATGLSTPTITETYTVPTSASTLSVGFELDGGQVGIRTLLDRIELSVTGVPAASSSASAFELARDEAFASSTADSNTRPSMLAVAPFSAPSWVSLGSHLPNGSRTQRTTTEHKAESDLILISTEVTKRWTEEEAEAPSHKVDIQEGENFEHVDSHRRGKAPRSIRAAFG